jgi:DNA polymerase-3 subunit epsilon
MREIVFDTETTGLDPAAGDRVIEIACVELVNLMPTGREFHAYFNPERDIPEASIAIHGLTASFLADKPLFADRIDDLLEFFDGAALVAHNAEFDMRFLQAELQRANRPRLAATVVDTLPIARRRFPGSPASLDALCRRFGIDLSAREKHGALIDTRLLAQVYLELMGGKEPALALAADPTAAAGARASVSRQPRAPRPHGPSEAELLAHAEHLKSITEPLWLQA